MGLNFHELVVNNANQTNYTFSAVDIGTPTRNRALLVGAYQWGGDLGTVTVAGVLGVRVGGQTVNQNETHHWLFHDFGLQAGSTADIVVTGGFSPAGCAVATFSISEGVEPEVRDTCSDSDFGSASVSCSNEVLDGDYLIATGQGTGSSATWSGDAGLVEDFDSSGERLTTGASHTATADDATATGTMNPSGGVNTNIVFSVLIPKQRTGRVANLVHDTSTTTGTGNQTLVAVNGKQSLFDAFDLGVNDQFHYFISNPDAAEWEIGTGHLSSSTVLVRDTVNQSSNSDALVSFTAGTKTITSDFPADQQGGAWDLLTTVTASNDTSIDITGLSSKHFAYKFVWAAIAHDSSGHLRIRTDANNGVSFDEGVSDYAWAAHRVSMQTTPAIPVDGDDASDFIRTSFFPQVSGEIIVTLFNPSGTEFTKMVWEGVHNFSTGSGRANVVGGGMRRSAALVDALQFFNSTGNIASGTLKVYGLRA